MEQDFELEELQHNVCHCVHVLPGFVADRSVWGLLACCVQLDDLIQANEQLMRENEVFRSFVDRHIPVRALGHMQAIDICVMPLWLEMHVQDADSLLEAEEATRKARGKKLGKKGKARPTNVTWEQKLEIAKAELDQVKKDAVETEKNSIRMIDTLKVRLMDG